MMIHVVRQGDTPENIARQYRIPLWLLLEINGLNAQSSLAEGQTVLILYPDLIHTVVPGDTLFKIASRYGVTLRQLYRNNPNLILKTYIYPEDPIVISYKNPPSTKITCAGYTYPFIDIPLFMQILPYVSDFNSFTYEITEEGHLSTLNDDLLISLASKSGTRPHMVVSNLVEPYGFDTEIAHKILGNRSLWEPFIEEILKELKKKKYSGVDMDFEYISYKDRDNYSEFMVLLHERLSSEGFSLTVALSAKNQDETTSLLTEGLDYKALGDAADAVLLMTYEWGYAAGDPMAIAPLPKVQEVLDYAVTRIPSDKILLGIPNYGYDWPKTSSLPRPRASSISNVEAVELALTTGARINYDEQSQAPWFTYTQNNTEHEVWFEDARSIHAKLSLIPMYKLKGAGYWNLMRPFQQNWSLLNSMFLLS